MHETAVEEAIIVRRGNSLSKDLPKDEQPPTLCKA